MRSEAMILLKPTYDVCPWVEVISWTSLCRDQPCQSSALFTILVLNEPADLCEVRLSIVFVYDFYDIPYLIVHPLEKVK